MSNLTRRQLLIFLGAAGGAAAIGSLRPQRGLAQTVSFLGGGPVTPLRLPHDLPIYQSQASYLPTSGTTGNPSAAGALQLSSYTSYDDVVVSPEFERYVIVRWGDRIFSNPDNYFGYNCDYTAYTPINGSDSEGYLWVNHEYVSFPIARSSAEAPSTLVSVNPPVQTSYPLIVGGSVDVADQLLRWGEFQYNQGGSVVRIRKDGSGRFLVVRDPVNRRYHGLSGLDINAGRTDTRPDGTPYSTITGWGPNSVQQGDLNYLIGTGPASTQVFNLSTDGLGNQIIGTAFNCSGGYTPWGTILSCEENFQSSIGAFFVGVQELVNPNGTQTGYIVGSPATTTDVVSGATFLNYTTGTFFGQVGEKYGWVVEIDPADPNFRARKHTWLGRFRHENIALRTETGKKLVAYMGDDRRGGHTYKYVSKGIYNSANSRDVNSALFENGTLYVARFNPDGTGRWIPLIPTTQVNPIAPSILGSQEAAERGVPVSDPSIARLALLLPVRQGVAGQTVDGGIFTTSVSNETTAIPSYRTKGGTLTTRYANLGDYYTSQGAILCDCYLASNLIGGTPTARPEDLEINPFNSSEVFIAYTDGAPGGDGYPDSRIFTVSKYTTAVNDTQQSGGLYKITEGSPDGTSTSFTWSNFKQAGESGSIGGGGFANVDNLAFDQDGNLWGVTDMTTSAHNGFNTTYSGTSLTPGQTGISHASNSNSGSTATSNLIGVFGANWLFYVPVSGPNAGLITPFAYGPPRCELTGPTFVGDTFILAVQHPGEDSPINGDPNAGGAAASSLSRSIEMLNLSGGLYNQTRNLLRGSNWPSNIEGNPNGPPRPSVIALRRKPS